MKTFKQFMCEQKKPEQEPANSRGVLVHGNKIFVGVQHGVTPNLDQKTHAMIQQHIQQHGHWDEGNGGDAEVTRPITGNAKSRGSFDENLVNRNLYTDKDGNRYTPHHHLTNLFGNLPGSEQEKNIANTLADEKLSLRDALIKHHGKIFDAPTSSGAVDRFLAKGGEEYQKMGQQKASAKNVRRFLSKGTAESWNGNENPDTGMGRMARQVQTERENFLMDKAPAGVYFIGSGHLPSMVNTLTQRNIKPNMVGGSHAHL